MATDWTGTALLTERLFAYVGAIGPTTLHAHHAVQIVIALESVTLRDGHGGCVHGGTALIPRDMQHAIEKSARHVLLVFVDPDDAVGRRLDNLADSRAESWFDAATPLDRQRNELSTTGVKDLEATAEAVVRELAGVATPARALHPAIRKLLHELPSRLEEDVRLPALARVAGLSPSRLSHLFTETVGVPLRPYILWLRLQRAAAEVQRGASLTSAAHAAGFSDSSHLSNTFRRMFGLTPSDLSTGVRWVTQTRPATE